MKPIKAYKHCPLCGRPTVDRKSHRHCPACGHDQYINPKPCTAVILVNDQGEYLLTERAFEPGKGLWDLPGGFVEEDETFEENAVREIKEETGIDIDPDSLHYIGSAGEPYPFQGVIQPTLSVIFIAKYPKSVQAEPADDVASLKFFSPADIPTDKLAFKAMRNDLRYAAEFLAKNKL